MFEPVIIGSALGVPLYAYGLWVAASAAACLPLAARRARRAGIAPDAVWMFGLLAIPLGLLCGHLFYCAVRATRLFPAHGVGLLFSPWKGGFGLGGVLGGCALAALGAARWAGRGTPSPPSPQASLTPLALLDALSPTAPLMIALCRLGEWLDGAGYGPFIEREALHFFPVGIPNRYGEYFFALFVLEALVGLCLCAALPGVKRRAPREGNAFLAFLILFGASQIPLESLRRDQFLRFGFVRVGQLTALLMVALAMATLTARVRRLRGSAARLALDWALLLLCVAVGVAMEFAFDKWYFLPNWAGYALMVAASAGMAALAFSQMGRAEPGGYTV